MFERPLEEIHKTENKSNILRKNKIAYFFPYIGNRGIFMLPLPFMLPFTYK